MVQTSSANATAITSIYYEKDQHHNSNNTSYTNNSSNNSRKFNANTATMTLLPFTHNKVGGHCPMFRLPYHQAICKAVTNTNERLFYKDILHHHPQFIPFLPHYMGSMRSLSSPSRLSATSAANTATAADLFASVTTPDAAYLLSPQLLQQQEIPTTVQDIEEEEYIILEDLTAKYRKPSLLDLKMGVRQHSCYARASKIASQTLKCESSTSRKLGVRLCGSQVYKTNKNRYDYQDKYAGRCLTSQRSFQEALYHFLHDGTRLLIELIPDLITKLEQLYQLIASLPGYRLYGSSLFILYDGDALSEKSVDVRLIDFARCVTRREIRDNFHLMTCPPSLPMEPDHGYLIGLQSIIHALENILLNESRVN